MKLIIAEDAQQAALVVSSVIIDLVKQKPDAWIMLPSGPTPILLYKALCEAYRCNEVDFKDTHFMAVDEYIGLVDEQASVNHQLQNQFFKPCQIDTEHIITYDPFADPSLQARNLNQMLDKLENGIDLIVTGIGQDGHIAYNKPNNQLYPHIHLDYLSESTRQGLALGFDDITEVPNQILTIGIKDLLKAKHLVLMTVGISKSTIVKQLLDAKTISSEFPASIVLLRDKVTLVVDSQAASECDPQ